MPPEARPRGPVSRNHSHCAGPLLVLAGLFSCVVAGADSPDLESVRDAIVELRDTLERDDDQLSAAREQAFALQQQISDARREYAQTEQRLERKTAQIDSLRRDNAAAEKVLAESQDAMARSLVARYVLTHQPRLKLLLNITEAKSLSRTLAYHDYITAAYGEQQAHLAAAQAQRAQFVQALKLEAGRVRQLRHGQTRRLETLDELNTQHEALIGLIEARMRDSGARLVQLEADEQKLLALVEQLSAEPAGRQPASPFSSLKGELDWPVQGRVAKAPGKAFRAGGARWAGVVIDGTAGDAVHAVAAGEIVYADWFRNLGRLVIIDHGEGFMSLYGNTEDVLIEPGAMVSAGDTIASIGPGLGDGAGGLYFELRSNGEPVDPRTWCASK